MSDKRNIAKVINRLKKDFSNPGAMELKTPYKTLVGVMLSARTRDEQVLRLLPGFFKSFPSPELLARASVKKIERHLSTIGMYRQKSSNLKKTATLLVENFNSKVPDNMEDLVSLPGVGRKTASVVLSASFNMPAIAVDTHVHRVTNRIGWVSEKSPEKTEKALLKIIPLKYQSKVNQVFVKFGRYICIPGKPRCWSCPIINSCSFKEKNKSKPKNADKISDEITKREESLENMRRSFNS